MDKRYFCASCSVVFTMSQNIGHWQCRMHISPERTTDARRAYYACCDLGIDDERASHDIQHIMLDQVLHRGCVRVDHVPLIENVPATRTVSDLHVIRDIPPSAGILIPGAAVVARFSVHYGDIVNPNAPFFTIPFNVPTASGNVTETRDIRPLVKALFDEKLGDDAFWTSSDTLKAQRDIFRTYRTSLGGTSGIAPAHKSLFSHASRTLPEAAFLKACVTTMHPPDVKLPVLVVRAAAPSRDADFLAKLSAQRAYINR